IRDLSQHVRDIDATVLAPATLQRLAILDPSTLPKAPGNPRCGIPVANIRKFIAIGLNYADHAAESNLPVPPEPVVFTKAISCLCGANDDVVLPPNATKGDWEVELGVVIGRTARN